MSPDTAPTTPTPEVSTPAPAEAESRANTAEKDLSVTVDALDVLKPEEGIKTIANLDFKIEDVIPPPAEAAAIETPEAKPVEKAVEAPAETPAAEAATETADAAPDDPDGLLDEAGQRQAAEQIARYKTLMQSIVQNKDIPDHLKAQLISEAAKGGIDLDPTKPRDGKRKFTNKQKWGIGIVGTLLFMVMAVGAGAAATKA